MQEPGTIITNHYDVESINDYLTKIQKLGGKVTSLKQEIRNNGWMAVAEDPEGNPFILGEPLRA